MIASLAIGGIALLVGCSGSDHPTAPAVDAGVAKAAPGVRTPAAGPAQLAVVSRWFGRFLVEGLDGATDLAAWPGQNVQLSWRAAGATGLGGAPTYRWGWDIADPDDPDEPGWACPRGNTAKYCSTGPVAFFDGRHDLTIERWDGDGLQVRAVFTVWIQPVARPVVGTLGPG